MAEQLENESVLADFSIVEPAQLPGSPFSPNRERLVILGLLFGLAFGVGLAAFLEFWDSTLRTEDDIMLALNLPTLASIPMMRNSAEVAKQSVASWDSESSRACSPPHRRGDHVRSMTERSELANV